MSSTEMKEIGKDRKKSGSSSSSNHSDDEEKNIGRRDEPEETDDPEVQFIQPNHAESDQKFNVSAPKVQFSGLTKDELMQFANDPFWRKVRWVLFILFWILWAGMLIAAILIIVFTPKCPVIPKQKFWRKVPGYHVDVSTFKDSDGNGIGDIKGLTDKIDYLKTKGGFLILSSLIKGSLGNKKVRSTAITDFKKVDESVGLDADLKVFMKKCRQNSIKLILEFAPHTGIDHEWFTKAIKGDKAYQNMYLIRNSLVNQMKNRVGKSAWNKNGAKYYFSSFHESLPALNLNDSTVIKELKDAVQFWLNQGFDGIFIDNAAFLAPDVDSTITQAAVAKTVTGTGDMKNWYNTEKTGQLYTDDGVSFIQEVRNWVNEVEKKTDRERLLLVSSGNTGFKQDREKTMAFLGTSGSPGAHSVVLFDLIPSQGSKVSTSVDKSNLRSRIDGSGALSNETDRITLVTQTLSGPRYPDLTMTVLNLLLPTTAVSLYGEEIGISGYKATDIKRNSKPYPEPAYWYITEAAIEDKNVYKNDMVDAYDVPMQWTINGGFSKKNVTEAKRFPSENVMSLSTIGIGQTRLDVFNKLVKVRKEPSLKWGSLEWIETKEDSKDKLPSYYIFSRSAEGFPKFIMAVIKPATSLTSVGIAKNLDIGCKNAKVLLSFPSNAEFKEDESIPMKNIFLKYDKAGSVYVFKCD